MKDLQEVFEERRSVNFFDKEKPLENGILEKIINSAVLAPSAFNLQPWGIIAVQSAEAKQKLFKLSNNQPKILDAPVTLIITGDRAGYKPDNPLWNDLKEMGMDDEKLKGTQNFAEILYGSTLEKKIKFAESNAALLAMSIMYAAKYYGVESHPASGIDFEGIKREFNIPGEQEAVMLICLGYFDKSKALYARRKRLHFSDIVKTV